MSNFLRRSFYLLSVAQDFLFYNNNNNNNNNNNDNNKKSCGPIKTRVVRVEKLLETRVKKIKYFLKGAILEGGYPNSSHTFLPLCMQASRFTVTLACIRAKKKRSYTSILLMNWIIVSIFLCVGPFFWVPPLKESPGPQKKSFFLGQKQFFFIYFLAELDHSKTFFFSKKNIFWGGSQNMTEGLRVPASTLS